MIVFDSCFDTSPELLLCILCGWCPGTLVFGSVESYLCHVFFYYKKKNVGLPVCLTLSCEFLLHIPCICTLGASYPWQCGGKPPPHPQHSTTIKPFNTYTQCSNHRQAKNGEVEGAIASLIIKKNCLQTPLRLTTAAHESKGMACSPYTISESTISKQEKPTWNCLMDMRCIDSTLLYLRTFAPSEPRDRRSRRSCHLWSYPRAGLSRVWLQLPLANDAQYPKLPEPACSQAHPLLSTCTKSLAFLSSNQKLCTMNLHCHYETDIQQEKTKWIDMNRHQAFSGILDVQECPRLIWRNTKYLKYH